MKKVMFVKKERGCATPEAKAEALKKYAHLERIAQDKVTGNTIKYYSWDVLSEIGKCAEVTIAGGRVVSVRNIPEQALNPVPKFGGF
jgi:hypothetical protein